MKNATLFLFLLIVIFIVGIYIHNLQSNSSKKSSSTLFTFGTNHAGQLGVSPDKIKSGFHTIPFKTGIKKTGAGRNFSAVVTTDGSLYTWGGNDWGQLGMKTPVTYNAPPLLNTHLSSVDDIAVSNNHAVALKNDGTVWTFGSNFSGQLGNGTNENSPVPIQVKKINNVKAVAAGYKFSIAIKKDGTLWGWGASCNAETKKNALIWWQNLGGDMTNEEGGYYDPLSDSLVYYDKNEYCINEEIVGILSKIPVQIKNISGVETASAGYGHVLALKKDGTVWSFGCNTFGQLGNREAVNKKPNAIPQKIDELKDIIEVSAGYRHSLALQKDGTVWGWGLNSHGQLGNSTTQSTPRPVKLPVRNVTHIIAGYDYSLVVKKDGTIWGWGLNKQRWFKNSDQEYVTHEEPMKQLKNVSFLSAGGAHVVGIQTADNH